MIQLPLMVFVETTWYNLEIIRFVIRAASFQTVDVVQSFNFHVNIDGPHQAGTNVDVTHDSCDQDEHELQAVGLMKSSEERWQNYSSTRVARYSNAIR